MIHSSDKPYVSFPLQHVDITLSDEHLEAACSALVDNGIIQVDTKGKTLDVAIMSVQPYSLTRADGGGGGGVEMSTDSNDS